ncbi:hypothetical protein EDC32_101464 [Laceyella sacchari]|jgi:hypothetical protein|nr:hypothetical protein EDC32_101464 [Laceyella sacchari]
MLGRGDMNKLLLFTTWDYWKSWHAHGSAIPAWTEEHAGPYEVSVEFDASYIGEMTDKGLFIISKKKPNATSQIHLFTKWDALDLWRRGEIQRLNCWTKDHATQFEVLTSFTFDEIHEHTYGGMFIAKRQEEIFTYPKLEEV